MELCREKGVVVLERSSEGALKMVFGPSPAPALKPRSEGDPEDPALSKKREHYFNLLGRTCSDKELEMLP